MTNSPACHDWWYETNQRAIDFRKRLLKESKLFKPLVPPTVHGQKWQDIPTDVLAYTLDAWTLDPAEKWHGFNQIALGEVRLSPLKLTILNPGVDLKHETYTKQGIPGVVLENFLHETLKNPISIPLSIWLPRVKVKLTSKPFFGPDGI